MCLELLLRTYLYTEVSDEELYRKTWTTFKNGNKFLQSLFNEYCTIDLQLSRLGENKIRKLFQRIQRSSTTQKLHIGTISLDFSHLSTTNIFISIKGCEPPLFRNHNLLTTREFILRTT